MNPTLRARSLDLNISCTLPLFVAAERSRIRALPLAARQLARRLGLPSATALAFAEAAGFSMDLG